MARLIVEWIPEDKEYYDYHKIERHIEDDATVNEMFEAWREMMSCLGYLMTPYSLEVSENKTS